VHRDINRTSDYMHDTGVSGLGARKHNEDYAFCDLGQQSTPVHHVDQQGGLLSEYSINPPSSPVFMHGKDGTVEPLCEDKVVECMLLNSPTMDASTETEVETKDVGVQFVLKTQTRHVKVGHEHIANKSSKSQTLKVHTEDIGITCRLPTANTLSQTVYISGSGRTKDAATECPQCPAAIGRHVQTETSKREDKGVMAVPKTRTTGIGTSDGNTTEDSCLQDILVKGTESLDICQTKTVVDFIEDKGGDHSIDVDEYAKNIHSTTRNRTLCQMVKHTYMSCEGIPRERYYCVFDDIVVPVYNLPWTNCFIPGTYVELYSGFQKYLAIEHDGTVNHVLESSPCYTDISTIALNELPQILCELKSKYPVDTTI
jgi:hypothetical protein